ncbi:MAG: ATP-binding protein [Prevotellaceae bacterium]|jgi:DNA transposition AAA+ family ATPase|nr:ATP-binding protein [Prevotellaceae bacterium]
MQITNEIKQRVVDALTAEQAKIGKGSNEYATYIENMLQIPFNKSAYSQIKQPKGYAAIKDATWLKLAKYFNCLVLSDWQTAKTNTYISVQTALELCRENGLWQVLCDIAGIGKSYAANEYAQANKGSVIYVDCSDCQSKSEFILELARQLGIEHTSTYNRLWRDVTDELLLIEKPLLILDEFGDVAESVITLLKGLYNKADMGDKMALGVYFIGADNLKKRLTDGRKKGKQSYAEFWSRFDNKITTLNFNARPDAFRLELRNEIEKIVDINLPAELADKREIIIEKCLMAGGVRSVRKEIALQRKIKSIS